MLCTQHVFDLECLLSFQTKCQPGVADKSVDYKKHLILFFTLLKMNPLLSQDQGVQKEHKKWGWPYRGGGFINIIIIIIIIFLVDQ